MEMRKASVLHGRIADLGKAASGPWGERALAQCGFVARLSDVRGGRFDEPLARALDALEAAAADDGAVGRAAAREAERALAPVASEAKAIEILCVGHAHTDMNWMWGWHETVEIVLSEFHTVLALMDEYPDFAFSHSQAATYALVERYEPAMLDAIRARVKEGRWEVAASTWVEADKNLPSGESLARHLLVSKRYLADLLGLDPARLDLDFEPDTFGHSLAVPEILAQGGVTRYYCCRGHDEHELFRWRAPSGAEVLVHREPLWYNRAIDAGLASYAPEFCARHGLPTFLKVYGIGNHGGGPTRRDIERILDMASWPVFPTVRFGTYDAYFRRAEAVAASLPVVEGEMNGVFTGCYTSASRIKAANRVAEARIDDAERFAAAASVTAQVPYPAAPFGEAWRGILFNQFHDILPGSGTIETREHAMGLFQETLALVDRGAVRALEGIEARIGTASLPAVLAAAPEREADLRLSVSEGAGVGHGLRDFTVPHAERGRGRVRVLHVHNPSAHPRAEVVAASVFDWPGDPRRAEVVDAEGRPLPFRVEPPEDNRYWEKGVYWDHKVLRLLVRMEVPAVGYATAVLREAAETRPPDRYDKVRRDRPASFALENERLRAVFDPTTAALRSLVDKSSGTELIDGTRFAGFRMVDEDDARRQTAWIVGRTLAVEPIARDVRLSGVRGGAGDLRSVLSWTASFRSSHLSVEVSLAEGSDRLEFACSCDFRETGALDRPVPQLGFALPLAAPCRALRCDVPFGTIDREPADADVPASSFALPLPAAAGAPSLMLVAPTKHGFRGTADSLALTLLRGSYDPDPVPEFGEHRFRFAIRPVADPEDRRAALEAAYDACHPLSVRPGTLHPGPAPARGSFLALEDGRAVVTAVKAPEDGPDGRTAIVRLLETDGCAGMARLRFDRPVRSVTAVDLLERPLPASAGPAPRADGDRVLCPLAPFRIATLRVGF